jgi:hypothetical protein
LECISQINGKPYEKGKDEGECKYREFFIFHIIRSRYATLLSVYNHYKI